MLNKIWAVAVLALATSTPVLAQQKQWLNAAEKIDKGQYLVTRSGVYSLWVQNDGNMVRYRHGKGLETRGYTTGWSTGTSNGNWLVMQHDGNVALYTGSNTWAWTSKTGGQPNNDSFKLVLEETGAIHIYKNGSVAHVIAYPQLVDGNGPDFLFPIATRTGGQCVESMISSKSGGNAMKQASWVGAYVGYCSQSPWL